MSKAYYHSPIGWLGITATAKGLQSVKREDPDEGAGESTGTIVAECARQLEEYFARARTSFELNFDWSGHTDFNISVWKALLNIPYGHTSSYSAIAKSLDNPKAVRAVGLANRNNPIAIIVPCHRVLAKSGQLHGYFYGLDVKRQLLELENPISFARQGSLF